jgi:hypothetical protein
MPAHFEDEDFFEQIEEERFFCCDSVKILEEDRFYVCLNCGFVYSKILDDSRVYNQEEIQKRKNIYCSYTILNPQRVYKPNDLISGNFYIENRDEKWEEDTVLKKVEIHIYEIYKRFAPHTVHSLSSGNVLYCVPQKRNKIRILWVDHQHRLGKYKFKGKHTIKPGETKIFKFEFKLPTWTPKTSRKFKGWYLALHFKQKTGLFLNLGKKPQTGSYIIPVNHSTKAGSPVSSYGEKEKSLV